jgi:hypothetical protein
MLLENKTAIIYGAGGAIGGAVARTFAREGAKVFLSGRTLSKVERVAEDIHAAGGSAEAFRVDALDERAVEDHIAAVVQKAGRLDISSARRSTKRRRGRRMTESVCALFGPHRSRNLSSDAQAFFRELGLEQHLTPQGFNVVRAMI